MVKFPSDPPFEEGTGQDSKPNNSQDLLFELFDSKATAFSFADSFLDIDSFDDWFEDLPMSEGERKDFSEKGIAVGMVSHLPKKEDCAQEELIVNGSGPSFHGSVCGIKAKDEPVEMLGNLGSTIEEEIGKINLVSGSGSSSFVGDAIMGKTENDENGNVRPFTNGGNGIKDGKIVIEDESGSSSSESVSEDSSSSGSSDSDSDSGSEGEDSDGDGEEEEGRKVKRKGMIKKDIDVEFEEGEVRDSDGLESIGGSDVDANKMVCWSDVDDDDDEDGTKGPIKSKNELEVLPPVPPIDVNLLPKHQMLPVGVILSSIGTRVVVEGVEKHNPLNEGSILWITESRLPLGIVDEIFGPVKNPYYVVRYNSESEAPTGIHQGTLVSFVPEFASHVLNNKDLYKKGYDASGANDEEISDDVEFSDDEKEAEYRRMQRLAKRGMNDQKHENARNDRKVGKGRNNQRKNGRASFGEEGSVSTSQTQQPVRPNAPSPSCSNNSAFPAISQGNFGERSMEPAFSSQPPGVNLPVNGVWGGISIQHLQHALFPNGFSTNGMPCLPGYNPPPFQMPMPGIQFNPGQGSFPTIILPGGQMSMPVMPFNQQFNPSQGSTTMPTGQHMTLPGILFNQQLNLAQGSLSTTMSPWIQRPTSGPPFNVQRNPIQGSSIPAPISNGEQGMASNGMPLDKEINLQSGNGQPYNQSSQGTGTFRGRRHFRGGRFGGGRGSKQTR